MAWVFDTYDQMHPGHNNWLVVTGKPTDLGGSEGRDQATGRGVVEAVERFLALGGVPELPDLDGARGAVQGLGDVGGAAVRTFRDRGARVVAVADSQARSRRTTTPGSTSRVSRATRRRPASASAGRATDLRTAAMVEAVEAIGRLATVTEERGIWP